jgi:hypothetical protein
MKFFETHFEEYANVKENLHPKLEKIFNKFPKKLSKLKNLIFYGPKGIGKYTQMLKCIKQYSPSELKYDKKISITYNKQAYFFKISDIHYEIDMSLLGCNSKLLWHEIYIQLVDIISTKQDKSGIIVCKYFNEIHSELLDNFYSYMQNNINSINLKYILITEELSFLPDNILNCCNVINIQRPPKIQYNKCLENKLPLNFNLQTITNIKNINSSTCILMEPHKIICDKIIDTMCKVIELKFLKFRDLLYDIFIYNLDITDCIWYINHTLMSEKKIEEKHMSNILIKTYTFFQFYNNNYRPIYHLEHYFFYLISLIHF